MAASTASTSSIRRELMLDLLRTNIYLDTPPVLAAEQGRSHLDKDTQGTKIAAVSSKEVEERNGTDRLFITRP